MADDAAARVGAHHYHYYGPGPYAAGPYAPSPYAAGPYASGPAGAFGAGFPQPGAAAAPDAAPAAGAPGFGPGFGAVPVWRAGKHGWSVAGWAPGAAAPAQGANAHRHPAADSLVKGLLVGAAAAYLLTNEKAQRAIMRAGVLAWAKLQGGVEELKERLHDAEAEVAASAAPQEPEPAASDAPPPAPKPLVVEG